MTLLCPICGSSDITPTKIRKGVQWYVCNNPDCLSPFDDPVVIDAVAPAPTETASTETTES